MYRSSHQKGFLTVLYSVGSSPLESWATFTKNGYVKRVYDEDIKSLVVEVMGSNVSTCFIHSPDDCRKQLGIKLPFLVLLIKNMQKYFCFEAKIKDDQHFMRRFRVSNFQSKTSVKPFCTAMPMGMSPGWNLIQFNLADFTRRAYGSNYLETVSLQLHANIRIRRIYFTDRLYTEAELPNEYRLMGKPKEPKQKPQKVAATARPPSPAGTARGQRKSKEEGAKQQPQAVSVKEELETTPDLGATAAPPPAAAAAAPPPQPPLEMDMEPVGATAAVADKGEDEQYYYY